MVPSTQVPVHATLLSLSPWKWQGDGGCLGTVQVRAAVYILIVRGDEAFLWDDGVALWALRFAGCSLGVAVSGAPLFRVTPRQTH